MSLFQDPLHEAFGTWPLGYIPYGGADVGEVQAVAAAVGNGSDDRYHDAWTAAAARLEAEAETSLRRGHPQSARELFLRASAFYGASFHLIYGSPVDPRLLEAFRRQMSAFDRGLALGSRPVRPQRIPYEGGALPAYFIAAQGQEDQVRPLIIFTNGYDGTVTDLYFASAVAASRRGYHSLIFDGPGQGAMLYERGVPMRPDWEVVIAAVMDFALALPLVDPRRIALSGWSLGGHLAPRAASGEHRIAALIADPGTWSLADGLRAAFAHLFKLHPEAVRDLGALDQKIIDMADAAIRTNRELNGRSCSAAFGYTV